LCSGVRSTGGASQGGSRLRGAGLVVRRVDHPVGVKRVRRFRHKRLSNRDASIFGASERATERATGGWHHRGDRRLSGIERWRDCRRENGSSVSWKHRAGGAIGIGW
jgi:hypothetical protein